MMNIAWKNLTHMCKYFLCIKPYTSSTVFWYLMIQISNYMQNNRHWSDFADAHTD